MTKNKVKSIVKKFPQPGGWFYIPLNKKYKDLKIKAPKYGLVPAKITIGKTTWSKSLLPLGDGTLFVALNQKIMKAEDLSLNDKVVVTFELTKPNQTSL